MLSLRSVVLLLLASPLAAGQAQFDGQQPNPPLTNGGLPLVEDFDGDGLADLLLGVWTGAQWELWFEANDGQGWFEAPQEASVPPGFITANVSADLDADGDLDLAAWGDAGTLRTALNDGSAQFLAVGAFPLISDYPGPLGVADFNLDGHVDVLAVHTFPGSASMLLGDGAGGLGAPAAVAVDGDVEHFAVGDVHGDGRPDLVLPNADGLAVTLIAGNGAGGFLPPVPVNAGIKTHHVALGDVTGDGKLDIAASRSYVNEGWIAIMANTGTGLFGAPVLQPSGENVEGLAVADMDGDGARDIVATCRWANAAQVFRSTAGGTSFPLLWERFPGQSPMGLWVADLDGDALPEAVCTMNSGGVSVVRETGGPLEVPGHLFALRALLIADATGDGRPDLLHSYDGLPGMSPAFVTLSPGDGAGGFAAPVELPSGDGPAAMTSADFDDDGRLDVVVANALSHDLWLLREVGGQWVSVMPGGWPWYQWNQAPLSVESGDFDGDGRPDLLVAKQKTSEISLVLANAAGGFKAPKNTVLEAPVLLVQALAGDFDDDGDLDAAFADAAWDGRVGVLLNDGAGTLGAPLSVVTPITGNHPIAAADFDRDGHLDVVTANRDVLLGDGTGALVSNATPALNSSDSWTAIADIDGDGLLDVVLAEFAGRLKVLRGDGAGALTGMLAVVSNGLVRALACGDLDGDHRPDLVAGSQSGNLTVHLNHADSFPWTNLGAALAGGHGTPTLQGDGALAAGAATHLTLDQAPPAAPTALVLGLTLLGAPFKGGILLPHPDVVLGPLPLDADGFLSVSAAWPAGLPSGLALHLQAWIADAGGPVGLAASNGLTATVP